MDRRSNVARWLMTLCAGAWLGLFPLLSGGTYAHITHDKWVIALALGAVSGAAGLAALCCRGRVDWRNPARLLALAYFAWMGATAFLGSSAQLKNAAEEPIVWIGSGRYEGMATQLCYMGVFLALSVCRPRAGAVAGVAAVGLLAYAAVVAVQYFDVNPFELFPPGRGILLNYEFQGTIGNIDMVSGYVLIVAPMLLAGWLLLSGRVRWLLLAGGLAGVLMELLMEVQGGLLTTGLLCGLMLCLLLVRPSVRARGLAALGGMCVCLSARLVIGLPWLDDVEALCLRLSPVRLVPAVLGLALIGVGAVVRRHPGRAVRPALVVCAAAALCVAAVALMIFLPVPEEAGGLYEIHEVLNGRVEDAYGSWRAGVWRHTLHLVRQSPLFGTGPDTFYPVMREHLSAEGAFLGENFDNPHNMFLAILSNSGVPALALFLLLLGACVARCVRRGDAWGLMLAASVIGYAAQGFFTFSICLVTPMFWAALGMACAPPDRKEEKYDPER